MTEPEKPIQFLTRKEEALFYGVTEAALRQWKSKGLKAGDVFPSNDPVAVVAWYRRNFEKSVPQSLAAAAARMTAVPKKRAKSKASALSAMDAGSLQEALERSRRIASLYGARLEKAIRDNDEAREEFYRGPCTKAVHQLGQIERAVVDIEKKRKELIPRHEVVIAWEGVIGLLPRALEKGLIAARPEQVAVEDWPGIVRTSMDKAFGLLNTALPELLAGPSANEQKTEEPEPTA